MTDPAHDDPALLHAKLRVPDHVVYRAFVEETVVLNLTTGKYHGLNATAGRMLEVLDEEASVAHAARSLARFYGLTLDQMEAELVEFCQGLLDRGLIEIALHDA